MFHSPSSVQPELSELLSGAELKVKLTLSDEISKFCPDLVSGLPKVV